MSKYAKWILLALSISLMINVFAVGHYVGQRRAGPSDSAGAWVSRLIPRDLQSQVSAEARQAFRKDIMTNRRAVREARATLKEARARLPQLLAQDTLDRAELKDTLDEIRGATTALQSYFESAFAAALTVMTPEERQKIAARMAERRKGGRRPGRRDGPPPPPPDDPLR